MTRISLSFLMFFSSLAALANPCAGTNATRLEVDACVAANAYRAQQGVPALTLRTNLNNVARAHAKDMSDRGYFEHDTPEGVSPTDRLNRSGINWETNAENIAQGQTSGKEVVLSWIGSPGHQANLVNPEFVLHGMGEYKGYWVHIFIK